MAGDDISPIIGTFIREDRPLTAEQVSKQYPRCRIMDIQAAINTSVSRGHLVRRMRPNLPTLYVLTANGRNVWCDPDSE